MIELSEFTVTFVAEAFWHEFTAVASVKPVPPTVTVLPPTLCPDPGDTPVTAGTGKICVLVSGGGRGCGAERRSRG